ncbi:sulfatase-like hydrolase/transferase [Haloferula helveola]
MKPILVLSLLTIAASAEPLVDSWITELSGRYARIYRDNDDAAAQTPVTTWSRGAGTQASPTYAGVHEIAATSTDLYVRSTGLGFHVMGPWYGGNGNLFPNYPSNRAALFRIPKTPDVSIFPKVGTGLGTIGMFVDGVSVFDSRDAFSYDTSAGQDQQPGSPAGVVGDDVWNRDAYVNEGDTFDPAFAHQAGNNHHYHANPPGLRHMLGDSVTYDITTHLYTESFNGNHSPILGWVADGLPIYGPYGFSDRLDPASPVRRMITGYQRRDGTNGSTNLAVTGRTTIPEWAVRNGRAQIAGAAQYGPAVSANFPIGHYLEDYAYKGDLGLVLGTDFDLNEYNVRFCVTPDFPAGTWAYFTNIAPDGTPVFPYNLSRFYFGDPTGGNVATIPGTAETLWEGGPEKPMGSPGLSVDSGSGDVTLVWSSLEGGTYVVERNDGLVEEGWEPVVKATGADAATSATDGGRASTDDRQFYRVEFESLASFDDTGFDYDPSAVPTPPRHNVLLLILDDWGIDASSLYNTSPGAELANMPTLDSLASAGLLFTRGYAQPICSPTRATMLTGRQPYQHGVGNPQADSTLPDSELTFPEIISTMAPEYGLASFGKWHLGSGNTGPRDTGGWPNFSGTLQGAVSDYESWTRIEIENGVLTDSGTTVTTYATTAQVDEAVSFIASQGSDPWVVWMGFNAPHDPFHDPPASLAPPGGYSTTGNTNLDLYIRMLEALDTEIGRLLAAVDLSTTNVIVVGDNGTPGQVDQDPAGGIAAAKGSLNEGGIHVPFFAAGPDVIQTGTTDKLVHVIDLFSTVLDLTGVNVAVATEGIEIHSRSLLPIFWGSDMEDRCVVAEKFNLNALDGRALMMDDWPEYKLISYQDVTDPADVPTYQMYELGPDGVETTTLTTPPSPGDAWEAAYEALVAKDEAMNPAMSTTLTVHIDLPGNAPALINVNNGNIVRPINITIGGETATWDTGDITVGGVTTSAARVDESGNPDQFSVVAFFDVSASSLVSGQSYTMVVTFPGAGGGRDFTATNTFTMP